MQLRSPKGKEGGVRETSQASPMGCIPFRQPPAAVAASKVKAKQTFPRLLNGVNLHVPLPSLITYLLDKIFLNMGFL